MANIQQIATSSTKGFSLYGRTNTSSFTACCYVPDLQMCFLCHCDAVVCGSAIWIWPYCKRLAIAINCTALYYNSKDLESMHLIEKSCRIPLFPACYNGCMHVYTVILAGNVLF